MSVPGIEARIAAQEARLVAQIAAGDAEEPTAKLFRKYRTDLYRFGLRLLRNEGLAEEMVQETFIKFCQSAGSYDPARGSVSAYLFAIARNKARDLAKRPSSRPLLGAEELQLPSWSDDHYQIVTRLALREAIGKLSQAHAEVVRLTFDESLTQTEIAERLGIALGTVKSRAFNALKALRDELTERGPDG